MEGQPGERFEPRQTSNTVDASPEPSKSLPLSPARQRLLDNIIALSSCQPSVERVKRYSSDCVYDNQFVYANGRYKTARQWFALPKLFNKSINDEYEVYVNGRDLVQFKNERSWDFKAILKTARINAIVSVSLDPATIDSDFIQVEYHKDQANEGDYSHEGPGFVFKKWQADNVIQHLDSLEAQSFKADDRAAKEESRTYGTENAEGNAPTQNINT